MAILAHSTDTFGNPSVLGWMAEYGLAKRLGVDALSSSCHCHAAKWMDSRGTGRDGMTMDIEAGENVRNNMKTSVVFKYSLQS